MSKKDYVAIAKAIRRATSFNQLVTELVVLFGRDNPRFDPAKFIKACGYGGGKP